VPEGVSDIIKEKCLFGWSCKIWWLKKWNVY
jgi:hypothetical protein